MCWCRASLPVAQKVQLGLEFAVALLCMARDETIQFLPINEAASADAVGVNFSRAHFFVEAATGQAAVFSGSGGAKPPRLQARGCRFGFGYGMVFFVFQHKTATVSTGFPRRPAAHVTQRGAKMDRRFAQRRSGVTQMRACWCNSPRNHVSEAQIIHANGNSSNDVFFQYLHAVSHGIQRGIFEKVFGLSLALFGLRCLPDLFHSSYW